MSSKPWAFWYSPSMGPQEQLWCAAQVDDLDQVRRCLSMGASASLPGPQGSAMDLAQEHQSYKVASSMGWRQASLMDEDVSLEQLDQAVAQIDALKSGLGVSQPGDDFLDILPFLGNAFLVSENPLEWAGIEEVRPDDKRVLFRMAHQHDAVLLMLSPTSPPTLLLSASGAKKWAPRLLESAEAEPATGSALN